MKGLKIHKLIPEKLSGLEELLQDVYLILRPKPSDYHDRLDLVRVFNDIAKELYGIGFFKLLPTFCCTLGDLDLLCAYG